MHHAVEPAAGDFGNGVDVRVERHLESAAAPRLQHLVRQLTEDGNVEITGRDLREKTSAVGQGSLVEQRAFGVTGFDDLRPASEPEISLIWQQAACV
jgi:hypothetical protein